MAITEPSYENRVVITRNDQRYKPRFTQVYLTVALIKVDGTGRVIEAILLLVFLFIPRKARAKKRIPNENGVSWRADAEAGRVSRLPKRMDETNEDKSMTLWRVDRLRGTDPCKRLLLTSGSTVPPLRVRDGRKADPCSKRALNI